MLFVQKVCTSSKFLMAALDVLTSPTIALSCQSCAFLVESDYWLNQIPFGTVSPERACRPAQYLTQERPVYLRSN